MHFFSSPCVRPAFLAKCTNHTAPHNADIYSMGLQFTARGHICKLCIYHKIALQFRRLYVPLIVIVTRAAREPAHNNGCGTLSKMYESPGLEFPATFSHLGLNILLVAVLSNIISLRSSLKQTERHISGPYENIRSNNLNVLIFKFLGSKWADKGLRSGGHRFPGIKVPFLPLECNIYLLVSLKNMNYTTIKSIRVYTHIICCVCCI
jgi:hypothetical protein